MNRKHANTSHTVVITDYLKDEESNLPDSIEVEFYAQAEEVEADESTGLRGGISVGLIHYDSSIYSFEEIKIIENYLDSNTEEIELNLANNF